MSTNPLSINILHKIVYRPRPFPEASYSIDLTDSDLLHFQLKNWRYRVPVLSTTNEAIDEPLKMYDDFCNLQQMWSVHDEMKNTPLTAEEELNQLIISVIPDYATRGSDQALSQTRRLCNLQSTTPDSCQVQLG